MTITKQAAVVGHFSAATFLDLVGKFHLLKSSMLLLSMSAGLWQVFYRLMD